MDGEGIQKLYDLFVEAVDAQEINGVHYSAHELHQVTPKLYQPASMVFSTLTGLVQYLEADCDKLVGQDVMVHVDSPRRVLVVCGVKGDRNQRLYYASAVATTSDIKGCTWMPPDEMTVLLNTLCAQTDDRDKAVQLVGNVVAREAVKLEDDGFTQLVSTRAGVQLVEGHEVPNPVMLAPYRTFSEVAQPASPFLLRFRGGGERAVECRLYEAGGALWELEAMQRVAAWLVENLPARHGFQILA